MGSDLLRSNSEDGDEGIRPCDDHANGAQHCDSRVDIESFSQLIENDINGNSRIELQRKFSSKGSARGGEKNIRHLMANQRNALTLATSPIEEDGRPEKAVAATVGTTAGPKLHHPITIKNGGLSSPAGQTKRGLRPTRSIHPRKILVFFATLSSLGTILLIYLTLSIRKLNSEDNDLGR